MGTSVIVPALPNCDFCAELDKVETAHYDGKTIFGPWANMCGMHFTTYGIGLGTGVGQRLRLKEKDNRETD